MDQNNPQSSGKKEFWSFSPMNVVQQSADLFIYDVISATAFWGDEVTPAAFQKELAAVSSAKLLNVHINSPGGNVFAANAIYSLLLGHPGEVHVYVDGVAASAASVIAMAGSKRFIAAPAMFMIHKPLLAIRGNANDLTKAIGFLDKVEDAISEAYVSRTNISRTELAEMLSKETWMSGREAVARGFATDLIDLPIAAHYDEDTKMLDLNGSNVSMQTFTDFEQFFTTMKGDQTMANKQEPEATAATETPAVATPATPATPATTATNTADSNIATLEASVARIEASIATMTAAATPENALPDALMTVVNTLTAEMTSIRTQIAEQKRVNDVADVKATLGGFANLGVAATDEVINSLVTVKNQDSKAYDTVVAMLTAASGKNAPLMTTTGTSQTPATDDAETFPTAVENHMKANPTCTYNDAVKVVAAANPALYEAYREGHRNS